MRTNALAAAVGGNRAIACAAALVMALALPGCAGGTDGQQETAEETTATVESSSSETIPESAYLEAQAAYDLMQEQECCLIDIRTLRAYQDMHPENAISMPAGVVEIRIREVPTDKPVILISQGEERIEEVWDVLVNNGIPAENIKVISGGIDAWGRASLPIVAELHIGC